MKIENKQQNTTHRLLRFNFAAIKVTVFLFSSVGNKSELFRNFLGEERNFAAASELYKSNCIDEMFVIRIPKSSSTVPPSTILALCLILFAVVVANCDAAETSANGGVLDDTLPVHKLRAAYEKVQAQSWRLVEAQFVGNGKLTDLVKTKLVKELFDYHHKFVVDALEVYERENKEQLRVVFPEFNHFYEWNYVQGHMNATDSLFEVFRQYLEMRAGNYNEEDALSVRDFADTVLYDKKWPIGKSFNDIHHIMVGQGLYYKMALV